LIYELTTPPEVDIKKMVAILNKTGVLIYAECRYKDYPAYSPNDTYLSNQNYLSIIQAYDAWDIEKGDTNIVIGIIDTGIDLLHEDLIDAIKYNYDDPIDGIDNDGDGYIDNFMGWDLSDNDNQPQEATSQPHGCSVAGAASPKTDNNKGVAGVGFKTKILPVKVVKDGSTVVDGLDKSYEGIVYAVDQGAQIINCSWGSFYSSNFGKDIIDYAVSKGALVVAAAGNTSSSSPYYPAAYDNVLGVGNTLNNNILAPNSGHGYWLDMCAPGGEIYTTFAGNNYNYNTGTSYSSPITAGAAALVKSYFPSYTNMQIKERLKVTCDDIEGLSGNTFYKNKLGTGRLNVYEALTATNIPGVIVKDIHIYDANNEQFIENETVFIDMVAENVLDPVTSLEARLRINSPYIELIDSVFVVGDLNTFENNNNIANPFSFKILTGAPFNTEIVAHIHIHNGNNYVKNHYFTFFINNYFVDVKVNNLWTTVSSNGMIGYYQEDQGAGIGISHFQAESLIWDASFMVGVPGKVVDMARGVTSANDQDFTPKIYPVAKIPSEISDFDVVGVFSDEIAPTSDKLNIDVKHQTFAWDKTGHQDYFIQEYTIINTGATLLTDVYAGVFVDWDIGNADNYMATADEKRLAFCYHPVSLKHAGVQVLTHQKFNHYAMYNNAVDGGTINPNSLFTSEKKYTTLSSKLANAGYGNGQDVSHTVSTGPYTIQPNDSVIVAFAFMAGNSLDEIKLTADSSYFQYNKELVPGGTQLNDIANNIFIYPNPSSNKLFIQLPEKLNVKTSIKLVSILGHEVLNNSKVALFEENIIEIDVNFLSEGIYFVHIIDENTTFTKKILIKR
jgi:serine protease